jgi:23S rRNA (cytidine1920-2'-O)/16S rRNA (cytidine1409-2'-O)-methyltransferase
MTRLDQALVERGLCESREKAKRAVMAGEVRINEQLARKPSDSVSPEDKLSLTAPEKFVSRGGFKLEHALNHFQLDVTGQIAVDLGASTGGFTDCLLQAGAKKVYAVDVGQGQLAWKLRRDSRVVVMEKTNARNLTPEKLFGGAHHSVRAETTQSTERRARSDAPCRADIVVIDCSFISLRKILPAAVALLHSSGRIVALIKPQFEAGKAEADKGAGVISDPAVHERVINDLREFVADYGRADSPLSAGGARRVTRPALLVWRGVTESPLLGPAGNKEFLVLIEKSG